MKYAGLFHLILITIVVVFLLNVGCKTSKEAIRTTQTLQSLVENEYFKSHYVGFGLFDPQSKQYLYQKNIDKYFTPASNTKIVTLYTALHIIKNRIGTLKYNSGADTVLIWGMGNPSFLHRELPQSETEKYFLESIRDKTVIFSTNNYQDKRYGAGWSWDDGLYTYQLEKTSLPIYGNVAKSKGTPGSKNIQMHPQYFQNHVYINIDTSRDYGFIKRDPLENIFIYNYQQFDTTYNERSFPIIFSPELLLHLLNDTFSMEIEFGEFSLDEYPESKTIFSDSSLDSIFQLFMQVSDNFIGEQLLLNCSMELFDTMSTSKIIAWAKDSIFQGFPDSLIWVDGSGLSRYNMFTPRTIIHTLDSIQNMKSLSWIKEIFPAGGQSGTIESWYNSEDDLPYVWAKTGTLRHNHCLSGFIQCASGKTMIFSFMHNHFTSPSSDVKEEMNQVLQFIKNNY